MLAALIRAIASLWSAHTVPPAPPTQPQAPAVTPAPAPAPRIEKEQVAYSTPLAGKLMDYLIGSSAVVSGRAGRVTVVPFDAGVPKLGIAVGYGNLFNEKYSEQTAAERAKYGPYLIGQSDTAENYGEGHIDPKGGGWKRNLHEQFEKRRKQGSEYIELDNPDAYDVKDVVGAVELAATYGLKVVCKNPLIMQGDPLPYVKLCHGAIVERGAGNPDDMHKLRVRAGKPDMPVWFVAFKTKKAGDGQPWAQKTASLTGPYKNMSVTYSPDGEYTSVIDVPGPMPWSAPPPAPSEDTITLLEPPPHLISQDAEGRGGNPYPLKAESD